MERRKHNSGIALVMVLGILSVMVIMAVAFAISMRTERVAAGNYADSVRARQLVQVGIARAMDDLAGKLGTNGLMSAAGGTNYPPWNVTNSYTTNYVNTSTNHSRLLTGEAINFVPRALWAAATNADYLNSANHWLPIESIVNTIDTNGASLVESNRIGRVKYLILNCSGLLDANFVGGATRGVGANSVEIDINNMPEMEVSTTFFTKRTTDVRYETLEELTALNTAFNGSPSNFTVYSRALPGYWATNTVPGMVGTQVNLAGSAGDLASRKGPVIAAFTNSGFSLPQAGILYSNLIDYVDADTIPSNFTTCVESVPMINEITISSMSSTSTPGKVENRVQVELWYPFVKFCGAFKFKLQYTIRSDPYGFTVGPYSYTNTSDEGGFDPSGIKFRTFSLLGVPFEDETNAPFWFTLTALEVQNTNGVPLDKILFFPDAKKVAVGDTWSIECIDPRFNENLTNNLQWTPFVLNNNSMGLPNVATTNYWSSDCDKDGGMYVANQSLRSVGELGYLAYDTWKTVKLYGTNLHRVFDYFAISNTNDADYVTNATWRGRVNPNAATLDALTAVFNNMAVNNYPDEDVNRLVWTNYAAKISAHLQTNVLVHGFYTNLSDIGRYFTNFPPTAVSELQKESIFRNTCGLLNVRQNLFAIIIEAHVASGGNIPSNPVRQRAVVLVWRDPYTGEMFKRPIIWLGD